MCLDDRGFVCTTTLAGVVIQSPDGEVVSSIDVPEAPANAGFWGADSRTLFVTVRAPLHAVEMDVAGQVMGARARSSG